MSDRAESGSDYNVTCFSTSLEVTVMKGVAKVAK